MKLGRVLLAACLFLTLVAHAQGGTIPRYTSVSFEVATTGAESAATVFVEESLAGRFLSFKCENLVQVLMKIVANGLKL